MLSPRLPHLRIHTLAVGLRSSCQLDTKSLPTKQYLSEVDERELWGQQYSPVSAGFGNSRHTIEKIYERYMHASILLQHLATAPLDTRQLH